MIKKLTYILTIAIMMSMTSCDDTRDNEGGLTTGTATVPMGISFSATWGIDDITRVAPPEQGDGLMDGTGTEEIKEIDRVRIIAFRRKDLNVTGQISDKFVYDPTNDQKVVCSEGSPNYTAQGALRKIYGYEYRVIAIAYDADDEGWFSLNSMEGMTYEEFEMTITRQNNGITGELNDYNVLFTPQFFYGYCHLAGSDDPIIKYGETEAETQAPLTGILYRAVAKVEVQLEVGKYDFYGVGYDVKQAALLMGNVYTQTKISSYDDFLSPYTNMETDDDPYTIVDYNGSVPSEGQTLTMIAYVLPTKTKLGLGVYYSDNFGIVKGTDYAWFSANDLSFADGATGVISPDVHDNEFYFRRNHKYVITGNTNNAFED